MSRIDHTPGPWVARPRHAHNDGSQDEMSGLGWDIDGPLEPMLRGQFSRAADARLVASAPDMYQALRAIRDSLDAPFDEATECCRVRFQIDAMVDEVLRTMESGGIRARREGAVTTFESQSGAVCVRNSEGAVAVNVQGLPVDAMSVLLRVLAKPMRDPDCTVRNAQPQDGLGAGVWFVLEAGEKAL